MLLKRGNGSFRHGTERKMIKARNFFVYYPENGKNNEKPGNLNGNLIFSKKYSKKINLRKKKGKNTEIRNKNGKKIKPGTEIYSNPETSVF